MTAGGPVDLGDEAPDRRTLIRRVCPEAVLRDGGLAHRFGIHRAGRDLPAFAVRYGGEVFAYVNSCPHRGTSLDWQPGEVFEESGLYLICATHGALFEPDSGRCIAGPCHGAHLQGIPVRLEAGHVVLQHDIMANITDD